MTDKNKFDEMREYLKNNNNKQFEGVPLPPMDNSVIDAMERIANNSTEEEKKGWINAIARKMMEEQGQTNLILIGLWKMTAYDLFGLNQEDLKEELNSMDREKVMADIEKLQKKVKK